jgi:hypothetical protein
MKLKEVVKVHMIQVIDLSPTILEMGLGRFTCYLLIMHERDANTKQRK